MKLFKGLIFLTDSNVIYTDPDPHTPPTLVSSLPPRGIIFSVPYPAESCENVLWPPWRVIFDARGHPPNSPFAACPI